MISESLIMRLVRQYANSPQGKREIFRKYGLIYQEDVSTAELSSYGEKMKQILFNHINPLIRSITMDDIIVGTPKKNEKGYWTLRVSFNEGSLQRDSLYYDGYPQGLNNIVLLFAHGYHARDYVYGWWDLPNQNWYGGNEFVNVRSRKDRDPNNFLYDAVDEFNGSVHGFAVATLEEKYK